MFCVCVCACLHACMCACMCVIVWSNLLSSKVWVKCYYLCRVQSRMRLCAIDAIFKKLVQPNCMRAPEGCINVAFGVPKIS